MWDNFFNNSLCHPNVFTYKNFSKLVHSHKVYVLFHIDLGPHDFLHRILFHSTAGKGSKDTIWEKSKRNGNGFCHHYWGKFQIFRLYGAHPIRRRDEEKPRTWPIWGFSTKRIISYLPSIQIISNSTYRHQYIMKICTISQTSVFSPPPFISRRRHLEI